MNVIVTGSSGLIGSEAVTFFDELGFRVTGVDNNMRALFFGPRGDTTLNRQRLERTCGGFTHVDLDIRDRDGVDALFGARPVDLVIHAAAQSSHDLAASRPFDDFDTNAVGTLNLLEACRRHRPDAVFIQVSTNKVYGDGPNRLELVELETRYEFADPQYTEGIDEQFPIDQSLHSLFGASKCAADLLAQEYGRYFGLKTGIFRAGCLTGPNHSGTQLHGFLAYLVRCAVAREPYTIIGYKGKQVRDNIHSQDLVEAFWHFFRDPHPGEVYNIGGGRHSNCSMMEAVAIIEELCGEKMMTSYEETNRVGDHIWWISDVRKFQSHYPEWSYRYDQRAILEEIHGELRERISGNPTSSTG